MLDERILTNLCRVEHNGFSHQAPGFVSTVLSLPSNLARVYFPADANQSVSIIAHCLRSKNCSSSLLSFRLVQTDLTDLLDANRRQLDRRNQGSVADLPDQGGSRGVVCCRRYDLGE